MSLLNSRHGPLIYGLISFSGLMISIFLMISNKNNSDFKSLLSIVFLLIAIIPSFLGVKLGLKVIKNGYNFIGIIGTILNLIVPLLLLIIIITVFDDIIKIFKILIDL
tara:strand:+ start:106428 stop:106751 length:324 start_codon:yes stop_codon:yes gene_type:complete